MISRRTALGALASMAATPAMAAYRKSISGQSVELPLQVSRGLPWTTVELADGRSFPFGITTGQRAWAAHPSVTNPDYVPGKNGGDVRLGEITVGGKLKDRDIPCYPAPGYFEGGPIAGLIGVQRYGSTLMEWDRLAMTVNVDPPAGYRRLPMDGTAGTYACVKVDIDGHDARLWVAPFIPWGLHLSTGYVKRKGLWNRFARRRDDYDGEGRVLHQSVIAKRVTVAGLELDNAVIRLNANEDRYMRHLNGSNDGIIGFDLLKRLNLHVARRGDLEFHVAYSGRRHEPYLDDRAGMAFTDHGGALTVTWIDADGPAWKAGVRGGDVLVAAQVEAGLAGLPYALTQPAGAQVPVEILRGKRRQRLVVTLEDRL